MKTRFELYVVLGALAIIGIVLFTQSKRTKSFVICAECIFNLRGINGAIMQFWTEHNEWSMNLPPESGGSKGLQSASAHYSVLSNYFGSAASPPGFLRCPSDKRKSAASWATLSNSNLSYFIAVDFQSDREILWAGDRNFSDKSNEVVTLDSTKPYLWLPKTGIHRGSDSGVLLVGSTPTPCNSKTMQAIIRGIAHTNDVKVAVP